MSRFSEKAMHEKRHPRSWKAISHPQDHSCGNGNWPRTCHHFRMGRFIAKLSHERHCYICPYAVADSPHTVCLLWHRNSFCNAHYHCTGSRWAFCNPRSSLSPPNDRRSRRETVQAALIAAVVCVCVCVCVCVWLGQPRLLK